MASTSVIASLQDLWIEWNIRGFMIFSLSMQVFLASISSLRRKTSNPLVILVIWSAYFLSDWVAIFAFGLISNAKCRNSTSNPEVDQDLIAFWSAFLLIHLGGPDSITAYSLEDNTLWLRHLVGLVVQVLAFLNIFMKTLPHNEFRVPTILIAIAGAIKYGERTRALYLASIENLKKSTVNLHCTGQNNNNMRPEGAESQTILDGSNNNQEIHRAKIKIAFYYFQTVKGLIIDMMPDHSQWLDTRGFFLQQDARIAYEFITMELRFFYEIFYTKVLAANSGWGVLIRSLAFYNILGAIIMFCLLKKEEINGVDVRITYSLLAGAIVLDLASEIMLVRTNWISVDGTYLGCQMIGHGFVLSLIVGFTVWCLAGFVSAIFCDSLIDQQWSESTGALNLLTRGFEDSRPRKEFKLQDYCRKINDKMNDKMGVVLTKLPYQWKNKLDMELWDFVFNSLRAKASPADDENKVRVVYEARGDVLLRNGDFAELKHYVEDFEFGKSLLIWHCATEICYQVDDIHVDEPNNKRRMFSKILSDYMAYLLIKQPKLMCPTAGIEQIRYDDTRVEVKNIGLKHPPETMGQFCKNIVEEHLGTAESDDRKGKGKSVLSEACNLAIALAKISTKWDTISEVWVEILSYAASHCRADSHARQLSEGGEFITFVWLLMGHFGIVPRFPKE